MLTALKFSFTLILFFATFNNYKACPCNGKRDELRFYLVLEYTIQGGQIRRWTLQGEKRLESAGRTGIVSILFSKKKADEPVEIDINNTSQTYIIVSNHWIPELHVDQASFALITELKEQLQKYNDGNTGDMTMGIALGSTGDCDCQKELGLTHDTPNRSTEAGKLNWKKVKLEKAPECSVLPKKTITAVFKIVAEAYSFRDNIPTVGVAN